MQDLRALAIFVEVAERLSFVRAATARHSCPFHPGCVTAGRGEMNMQISGARIGELPFDCLFEPDAFSTGRATERHFYPRRQRLEHYRFRGQPGFHRHF